MYSPQCYRSPSHPENSTKFCWPQSLNYHMLMRRPGSYCPNLTRENVARTFRLAVSIVDNTSLPELLLLDLSIPTWEWNGCSGIIYFYAFLNICIQASKNTFCSQKCMIPTSTPVRHCRILENMMTNQFRSLFLKRIILFVQHPYIRAHPAVIHTSPFSSLILLFLFLIPLFPVQ